MQIVYCETAIKKHPRVQRILQRFGRYATFIECESYQQVFNPKSQNFRLQKSQPALILAQKTRNRINPTPEGFGIGGQQNYYFSHMLNCLYDCRYCFLQGMYPSANYLIFVNYEDFMSDIEQMTAQYNSESVYFFSGYDCDSLAFESVTEFAADFIPFFSKIPTAILELRTKSVNIQTLLSLKAITNCVVAFSFTPDVIAEKVEHKTPPVAKRLIAMRRLAAAGWKIGLRFDPLILCADFAAHYQQLIDNIFQMINSSCIHSVSIGPLRFPQAMYQRMVKLYPQEKLLAQPLYKRDQYYSYQPDLEQRLKKIVLNHLKNYLPETLLFECSPL